MEVIERLEPTIGLEPMTCRLRKDSGRIAYVSAGLDASRYIQRISANGAGSRRRALVTGQAHRDGSRCTSDTGSRTRRRVTTPRPERSGGPPSPPLALL